MRDDYARPTTSVTTWIICATLAGFILQHVTLKFFPGPAANAGYEGLLELSAEGIASGKIWTLLTYSLLHAKYNLLHVVVNMLMVFFLGREILPLVGSRRFLGLYGGGVLLGGLLWLATNWTYGGQVIGASAGVAALFMMFTALAPNRPFTFLLFFIVPVTVKPKWVLIVLGSFDLFGFVFFEAFGDTSMGNVAHSAHLGGYAAGWLFFRYVYQREWRAPDRAPAVELPAWMSRSSRKTTTVAGAYKVNLTAAEPEK
ncbi:MAG: rhomboid family intramembrane serine protease, partial [Rhodanobacter sp.]